MRSIFTLCAALILVCATTFSFAGAGDSLPINGVKSESSIVRAQSSARATNAASTSASLAKSEPRVPQQGAGGGNSSCEVCGYSDILEPARKPQSALLLPAVQKVRATTKR
jgi:hypothetical protein